MGCYLNTGRLHGDIITNSYSRIHRIHLLRKVKVLVSKMHPVYLKHTFLSQLR